MPRDLTTSEVALYPSLWCDRYVAMGDKYADGSWSFNIQRKPLVRWIWLGALGVAVAAMAGAIGKNKRVPTPPSAPTMIQRKNLRHA